MNHRHAMPADAPRAAYVHVPFCAHRCGYCNFTVAAGRPDLIDAYLRALERELEGLVVPRPVETLYVGGGTPTQLGERPLERLLEMLVRWYPLREGGEWTVEANPADLDLVAARRLARFGVTRISLGAQSFDPEKLRLLERDHNARRIRRAYFAARRAVPHVSLDLIFAVPGETLGTWRHDLTESLALEPDHLSTYGLTFEKGAAFWSRLRKGVLRAVDEAAERAMYGEAIDRLQASGFEHYEVSNFARPGRRCRHNEVYWLGEPFFGSGPGAARYVSGCREVNHRSTTRYIRSVLAGDSAVAESERLSAEDRARERLVFGLRRLEGIDRQRFAAETGYTIDELAGRHMQHFLRLGLWRDDGRRVHLTREGLMLSDSMWPYLLRA